VNDAATADLPRFQAGMPPQHLITTLLGDYWFEREEHLPSAALVRLAGEFGVSAVAARAALSRLTRRDLLESSKIGRRTYYRLTDRAAAMLSQGVHRVVSFGLDREPWDGHWAVAGFSIPEDQRDLRHTLRTRLRWLGFAPLYDGLWVSPTARPEAVVAALSELKVCNATVFRATAEEAAWLRSPHEAWDFDLLRRGYDDFLARYEPLLARVRQGTVGAAEALVARSELMDAWRAFPGLDPGLPAELLPADWPRGRARAVFAEIYDTLGPLAEIRVRQIVAEFDADLAALVRHHSTATLLAAA